MLSIRHISEFGKCEISRTAYDEGVKVKREKIAFLNKSHYGGILYSKAFNVNKITEIYEIFVKSKPLILTAINLNNDAIKVPKLLKLHYTNPNTKRQLVTASVSSDEKLLFLGFSCRSTGVQFIQLTCTEISTKFNRKRMGEELLIYERKGFNGCVLNHIETTSKYDETDGCKRKESLLLYLYNTQCGTGVIEIINVSLTNGTQKGAKGGGINALCFRSHRLAKDISWFDYLGDLETLVFLKGVGVREKDEGNDEMTQTRHLLPQGNSSAPNAVPMSRTSIYDLHMFLLTHNKDTSDMASLFKPGTTRRVNITGYILPHPYQSGEVVGKEGVIHVSVYGGTPAVVLISGHSKSSSKEHFVASYKIQPQGSVKEPQRHQRIIYNQDGQTNTLQRYKVTVFSLTSDDSFSFSFTQRFSRAASTDFLGKSVTTRVNKVRSFFPFSVPLPGGVCIVKPPDDTGVKAPELTLFYISIGDVLPISLVSCVTIPATSLAANDVLFPRWSSLFNSTSSTAEPTTAVTTTATIYNKEEDPKDFNSVLLRSLFFCCIADEFHVLGDGGKREQGMNVSTVTSDVDSLIKFGSGYKSGRCSSRSITVESVKQKKKQNTNKIEETVNLPSFIGSIEIQEFHQVLSRATARQKNHLKYKEREGRILAKLEECFRIFEACGCVGHNLNSTTTTTTTLSTVKPTTVATNETATAANNQSSITSSSSLGSFKSNSITSGSSGDMMGKAEGMRKQIFISHLTSSTDTLSSGTSNSSIGSNTSVNTRKIFGSPKFKGDNTADTNMETTIHSGTYDISTDHGCPPPKPTPTVGYQTEEPIKQRIKDEWIQLTNRFHVVGVYSRSLHFIPRVPESLKNQCGTSSDGDESLPTDPSSQVINQHSLRVKNIVFDDEANRMMSLYLPAIGSLAPLCMGGCGYIFKKDSNSEMEEENESIDEIPVGKDRQVSDNFKVGSHNGFLSRAIETVILIMFFVLDVGNGIKGTQKDPDMQVSRFVQCTEILEYVLEIIRSRGIVSRQTIELLMYCKVYITMMTVLVSVLNINSIERLDRQTNSPTTLHTNNYRKAKSIISNNLTYEILKSCGVSESLLSFIHILRSFEDFPKSLSKYIFKPKYINRVIGQKLKPMRISSIFNNTRYRHLFDVSLNLVVRLHKSFYHLLLPTYVFNSLSQKAKLMVANSRDSLIELVECSNISFIADLLLRYNLSLKKLIAIIQLQPKLHSPDSARCWQKTVSGEGDTKGSNNKSVDLQSETNLQRYIVNFISADIQRQIKVDNKVRKQLARNQDTLKKHRALSGQGAGDIQKAGGDEHKNTKEYIKTMYYDRYRYDKHNPNESCDEKLNETTFLLSDAQKIISQITRSLSVVDFLFIEPKNVALFLDKYPRKLVEELRTRAKFLSHTVTIMTTKQIQPSEDAGRERFCDYTRSFRHSIIRLISGREGNFLVEPESVNISSGTMENGSETIESDDAAASYTTRGKQKEKARESSMLLLFLSSLCLGIRKHGQRVTLTLGGNNECGSDSDGVGVEETMLYIKERLCTRKTWALVFSNESPKMHSSENEEEAWHVVNCVYQETFNNLLGLEVALFLRQLLYDGVEAIAQQNTATDNSVLNKLYGSSSTSSEFSISDKELESFGVTDVWLNRVVGSKEYTRDAPLPRLYIHLFDNEPCTTAALSFTCEGLNDVQKSLFNSIDGFITPLSNICGDSPFCIRRPNLLNACLSIRYIRIKPVIDDIKPNISLQLAAHELMCRAGGTTDESDLPGLIFTESKHTPHTPASGYTTHDGGMNNNNNPEESTVVATESSHQVNNVEQRVEGENKVENNEKAKEAEDKRPNIPIPTLRLMMAKLRATNIFSAQKKKGSSTKHKDNKSPSALDLPGLLRVCGCCRLDGKPLEGSRLNTLHHFPAFVLYLRSVVQTFREERRVLDHVVRLADTIEMDGELISQYKCSCPTQQTASPGEVSLLKVLVAVVMWFAAFGVSH